MVFCMWEGGRCPRCGQREQWASEAARNPCRPAKTKAALPKSARKWNRKLLPE